MSPKVRCPWAARAVGLSLAVSAAPAAAVVGGDAASGPAYRSTLMVLNSRGGMCSGVVLAPDIVLTAGHCVPGRDQVRVHYQGEDGAPVLLEPAARSVHPGFVPGAEKARRRSIDLAILRLRDPLPARFEAATLAPAAPGRDTPVTLGGYGVLAEGDHRSTGVFRTARLAVVEPFGPSQVLLWAKDADGRGAGACEGDSGGPIYAGDGSVAAVTSWAAGKGEKSCGDVSQGILVGPQRAWIDRTLGAWGRRAAWR